MRINALFWACPFALLVRGVAICTTFPSLSRFNHAAGESDDENGSGGSGEFKADFGGGDDDDDADMGGESKSEAKGDGKRGGTAAAAAGAGKPKPKASVESKMARRAKDNAEVSTEWGYGQDSSGAFPAAACI